MMPVGSMSAAGIGDPQVTASAQMVSAKQSEFEAQAKRYAAIATATPA